MSKAELRDGRRNAASYSRIKRISQDLFNHYDSKLNEIKKANQQPVLGPKMQIISAYKQNKNLEDAYKMANDINQKIGKEVNSKDLVDLWIKEEIEKEKRIYKNRNEEDDAR